MNYLSSFLSKQGSLMTLEENYKDCQQEFMAKS